MITKTKKKDVFLTKAQFTKLITNGTLEEGVIYHVTDENAGHELALDESVLKLLDSDGATISQVELPQSGGVETIDLDIVRGTDGTLSSTELENIKNDGVVFVSARMASSTSAPKILLTKTLYTKGATTTGTIFFSSNILASTNSNFTEWLLQINLSTGVYTWRNSGIAMIQLNAIVYGTDGILTEAQLENVKDANSYHTLIHFTIRGTTDIGYDYLTYTDTKATANEIIFTASGLRPITLDLTTGAYTFGEIEDEVTYATDEDIDGLFATMISFKYLNEKNANIYDTYQAKEGMTWGEWIDSEYNTVGLRKNTTLSTETVYVSPSVNYLNGSFDYVVTNDNSRWQSIKDVIIAGENYYRMHKNQ